MADASTNGKRSTAAFLVEAAVAFVIAGVLVVLALVVLVIAIAGPAEFFCLDPGPCSVRVEVDPALTSEGAWQVGPNTPPTDSRLESLQVEAEALADGRMHVAVRREGSGRGSVDEFWFDHSSPERVTAVASSRAYERSSEATWHVYISRGWIKLSSASAAPPLVVECELEGDQAGSPVTLHGKVAIAQTAK